MHIVLFGATGNVGQRIAREAVARGHQVTGVVRDPAQVSPPDPRVALVAGDATDAASVERLANGADAIVSAISPRPNPRGLPAPRLADAARAVIAGARAAGVARIVSVGGTGSLDVAPGQQLMNAPTFPEAYRAEAREGFEALTAFREHGAGLDWTVVSPAAEIGPGERTGRYRDTGDRFVPDATGRSTISFDDYAVAVLDELEAPKHAGGRFGVAY